jgi:phosphoserine phosphatase
MKKNVEKLAVFDLDGTLWCENSHLVILNQYYKTKLFSSYFSKGISLLVPKIHLYLLHWLYNRVPQKFVDDFSLPFRNSALELLNEKKREGYYPIIISNAPNKIIEGAARRLDIAFYRADIGKKDKVVKGNFKWDNLFVCTDNVSDTNLIYLSDTSTLYVNKNNVKLFESINNAVLIKEDI